MMEHGLSMHEALGYIRSVLQCHPSHRQLEVVPKKQRVDQGQGYDSSDADRN